MKNHAHICIMSHSCLQYHNSRYITLNQIRRFTGDTASFTCDNGKCIDSAMVCDGFNDCGDFSDENIQCGGSAVDERRWSHS